MQGKIVEGKMEGYRMVMEVEGVWSGMGWDGDGELREGRYWDVGLCTGVGVSGGVGSSVGGPIS